MKIFYPIVFIAVILSGCATTSPQAGKDYAFWYEDNPQAGRIDVHFKSLVQHQLCLQHETWPTGGKFDAGSPAPVIVIDGTTYHNNDRTHDSGYCPRCAVQVAGGKQVDGFIPYADYAIPESATHSAKTLVMTTRLTPCEGTAPALG